MKREGGEEVVLGRKIGATFLLAGPCPSNPLWSAAPVRVKLVFLCRSRPSPQRAA